MKKLSFLSFIFIITSLFSIAFLQACGEDGEDLTTSIVGSYKFELRENGTLKASNIATTITKESNTSIKIAITGKETVTAKIEKPATGDYLLINVLDQKGITNGTGGDFVSGAINIGFTNAGVIVNYYGVKN